MDFHTLNIDTQCAELLDYWFSGTTGDKMSRWFSKKNTEIQRLLDRDITHRFGDLFLKIEDFKFSPEKIKNHKLILSVLLLTDQISRHIYRQCEPSLKTAKIAIQHKKALSLSLYCIKNDMDKKYFSPEELIFILLPIRHTLRTDPNHYCLYMILYNRLLEYSRDTRESPLFKKFVYTSQKVIMNSIKQHIISNMEPGRWVKTFTFDHYRSVLEKPELDFMHSIIKKKTPFNFAIEKEPIYHHILEWLRYVIKIKTTKRSVHHTNPISLIVSLSGGVDSMVLCQILYIIQQNIFKHKISAFKIIAMHIDYGNRKDSSIEQEYVSAWCSEHRITFYPIYIPIKRELCDRELYEKTTRDIRYNAYKKLVKDYNSLGVLLGHQQDDKVENIFTNIMNGRSLLDLEVLQPFQTIMSVPIHRPLISIDKDTLFAISHKYKIPYFKNTTPSWSNRGILRERVLPSIISRYGPIATRKNLLAIGKSSSSWNTIIRKKLLEPFWASIQDFEFGLLFSIEDYDDMDKVFWESALLPVFHSLELSMISKKTLDIFVEKMNKKRYTSIPIWITFKKNCIGLLHHNRIENSSYCLLLPKHKCFKPIPNTIQTIMFTPNPTHKQSQLSKLSINIPEWCISITKYDTVISELHSHIITEEYNTKYTDFLCGEITYGVIAIVPPETAILPEFQITIQSKYIKDFDVIASLYKRIPIPIVEFDNKMIDIKTSIKETVTSKFVINGSTKKYNSFRRLLKKESLDKRVILFTVTIKRN